MKPRAWIWAQDSYATQSLAQGLSRQGIEVGIGEDVPVGTVMVVSWGSAARLTQMSPAPEWESVLLVARSERELLDPEHQDPLTRILEELAVPAWTRALAVRWAPRVRVNALLLGGRAEADWDAVAETAMHLLAHSPFTTGAALTLDGGVSL